MAVNLAQIRDFTQSPAFNAYSRWQALKLKAEEDTSLRFNDSEITLLETWPAVRVLWEETLPQSAAILANFKTSLTEEVGKYETAVKDLEKSNKLFAFYKEVLDRLTRQYLESLSGMLTEVYQNVFNDFSKTVFLEMVDFRNKKVIRLNLVKSIGGKQFVENLSTQGGSATVVLGLIVSIYFLLTTGGERIIFIDEQLAQLHSGTLDRFMEVLRKFVSDLGFVFVIVSHDSERMESSVDKVYSVANGVYALADKEEFFNSRRARYFK